MFLSKCSIIERTSKPIIFSSPRKPWHPCPPFAGQHCFHNHVTFRFAFAFQICVSQPPSLKIVKLFDFDDYCDTTHGGNRVHICDRDVMVWQVTGEDSLKKNKKSNGRGSYVVSLKLESISKLERKLNNFCLKNVYHIMNCITLADPCPSTNLFLLLF